MKLVYWTDMKGVVHIVIPRWNRTACPLLEVVVPERILVEDAIPTCLQCIAKEPMYERIIET